MKSLGSFGLRSTLFASLISLVFLGCQGDKPFDGFTSQGIPSGYIVVTTNQTDANASTGIVSIWTPEGDLYSTMLDLSTTSEWAAGSVFLPPDRIALSIEGTDRLGVVNFFNPMVEAPPIYQSVTYLTSTPVRQVTMQVEHGQYAFYVAEGNQNTVEKFVLRPDSTSGARAGNPFIPANVTTNGVTCALAAPWGLTSIPTTSRIAVISTAASGRLSIYDQDGNCVAHLTGGTLGAGTPIAVAYHAQADKLLVTFATSHAIYAFPADGSSNAGTLVYQNSAIINTPRAITTDSDGNIYVGSVGTDTIEKLTWTGTGLATLATSGPLIRNSIFTANPTSITVIP